jgi:ketosteroid isomerase-like protein
MKNMKSTWLSLAILAVAAFSLTNISQASADDSADVAAASNSFYSALNTLFSGEVGPMLAVWSHANDVIYMGPTGKTETSWAPIEQIWKDQAAQKLSGKVSPGNLHIIVGQDLAVVSNVEDGVNFDNTGKRQEVKIRATSIYRKEDGVWKMIGHHTDVLPFLENETTLYRR